MADGDAMRFISEELGTGVGFDTDGGSGIATGWTFAAHKDVSSSTKTIDTGEQRTGAGCQKLVMSTAAASYCTFSQTYTLPGRSDLSGKGHVGATFTLSVYGKRGAVNNTESIFIIVEEYDSSDVLGTSSTTEQTALTTSYAQLTHQHTITDSDVSYIKVLIKCYVGGPASNCTYYLDDASLKFDYTVATNPTGSMGLTYSPSLPETGEASINNTYYRQRNTSTVLKFRDVSLNFGLTPTAQKNALRAMTFYDKLFTWYPYNPDLPSTLDGYFKMLGQPVPIGTRWNRWSVNLKFDER